MSIVGRLSTLRSVHYRRFHCIHVLIKLFSAHMYRRTSDKGTQKKPSLQDTLLVHSVSYYCILAPLKSGQPLYKGQTAWSQRVRYSCVHYSEVPLHTTPHLTTSPACGGTWGSVCKLARCDHSPPSVVSQSLISSSILYLPLDFAHPISLYFLASKMPLQPKIVHIKFQFLTHSLREIIFSYSAAIVVT